MPNPATPSEPEKKEAPECSTREPGALEEPVITAPAPAPVEDCSRERLKRHRVAMAGRVWIPEIWGQESLLKEWKDCSDFDRSLVPKGVVLARKALVDECRRANTHGLPVVNRC